MKQVLDLGCKPEKIIFANPIKTIDQIKYAKECGVKLMTFDCKEELIKIKKYYPKAQCVMRIVTQNSEARYNLNEKYGVHLDMTEDLL